MSLPPCSPPNTPSLGAPLLGASVLQTRVFARNLYMRLFQKHLNKLLLLFFLSVLIIVIPLSLFYFPPHHTFFQVTIFYVSYSSSVPSVLFTLYPLPNAHPTFKMYSLLVTHLLILTPLDGHPVPHLPKS